MSAVEAAEGLDTCQEAGGVAVLPHRASELAEKRKIPAAGKGENSYKFSKLMY